MITSTGSIFSNCLNKPEIFSLLEFKASVEPSHFTEVEIAELNKDSIKPIEVNLLQRFDYIAEAFINRQEIPTETQNHIIDLVVHFTASTDLNEGMTFTYLAAETLKKFFKDGSSKSLRSKKITESLQALDDQSLSLSNDFLQIVFEQSLFGFSQHRFLKAFKLFFTNGFIYRNVDRRELLAVLNEPEDENTRNRFFLFDYFFVPIEFKTTLFYKFHFGVIGSEKHMLIDKICITD